MARAGSKTAAAIAVMEANANLPMEEVLPIIAAATGHDIPHARNYYVWCVRKGVAPGIVPVKARKSVARKTAAPKAKAIKTKKEAVAAVSKSPEEVARIREANLMRMREIGNKYAKGKKPVAETRERDSFDAPAFLTKDEVTALV